MLGYITDTTSFQYSLQIQFACGHSKVTPDMLLWAVVWFQATKLQPQWHMFSTWAPCEVGAVPWRMAAGRAYWHGTPCPATHIALEKALWKGFSTYLFFELERGDKSKEIISAIPTFWGFREWIGFNSNESSCLFWFLSILWISAMFNFKSELLALVLFSKP